MGWLLLGDRLLGQGRCATPEEDDQQAVPTTRNDIAANLQILHPANRDDHLPDYCHASPIIFSTSSQFSIFLFFERKLCLYPHAIMATITGPQAVSKMFPMA